MKPTIVKQGDPDCAHHEVIDASLQGRCLKCGQIRSYGSQEATAMFGTATEEEVAASRKRGVAKGAMNPSSAAWAGIYASAMARYQERRAE